MRPRTRRRTPPAPPRRRAGARDAASTSPARTASHAVASIARSHPASEAAVDSPRYPAATSAEPAPEEGEASPRHRRAQQGVRPPDGNREQRGIGERGGEGCGETAVRRVRARRGHHEQVEGQRVHRKRCQRDAAPQRKAARQPLHLRIPLSCFGHRPPPRPRGAFRARPRRQARPDGRASAPPLHLRSLNGMQPCRHYTQRESCAAGRLPNPMRIRTASAAPRGTRSSARARRPPPR